jgi:hypothetical protein
MKPCDCKSWTDLEKLEEQGIGHNNKRLIMDSTGVFIDIDPYVRIKIPHTDFKRFAVWYLEDQQ